MTKHLVLDCGIFGLQRFGGISNFWSQLVQHAQREWTAGCTLVLPAELRFREMPDLSKATIYRETIPNRFARYLTAPMPVRNGILHSAYYRRPARGAGAYIVSVHDFTYERYRTGTARLVHHLQKRRAVERADYILCISESTRADLLEAIPGIDPGRVRVTPLAVDHSTFFPDTAQSDPPPEPYVLFVGERAGYKRFDLAVEALRALPDLRLGIVGAPLAPEERTLLHARLPNRWIEFGRVRSDELRGLYSRAQSFIFPSDYEGFGLPLLEAMACGCPVVAAARSSFPEVVGGAGLLAASQDAEVYAALINTLSDTSHRSQLVEKGLARAQQFSWRHTFDGIVNVYREA